MRQAPIQLVGRRIKGGHHPRLAPAPAKGKGIGQILAQFGALVTAAQGIAQNGNATRGIAGHRQRQAIVTHGNSIMRRIQQRQCVGLMPAGNLRESQPQRRAAGGVAQSAGIRKHASRRFKPSRAQIYPAQHHPHPRGMGIGGHGGLGQHLRPGDIAPRQRLRHLVTLTGRGGGSWGSYRRLDRVGARSGFGGSSRRQQRRRQNRKRHHVARKAAMARAIA